ncbi:hypothetical protein [Streptomyces sp. KLOTTS4A1]|uniref:hypothetical protein n=1 Tax=Streptomyces sp. KLOTTS4A1 TaxID=3390996 RepID=UPI0039F51093
MVDENVLDERLSGFAADSAQVVVPLPAELIRARGDRRRRRKRAAQMSGGALLAVAVAVGGLTLFRPEPGPGPAADPDPSASASLFVAPTPVPGQEYATELGYVYDAVALDGDRVRITVEQVREEPARLRSTGVVHELTLAAVTPVEVAELAGGKRGDMRLVDLVDRLKSGPPQWVFALDYDGEGRVQSLREAYWLSGR